MHSRWKYIVISLSALVGIFLFFSLKGNRDLTSLLTDNPEVTENKGESTSNPKPQPPVLGRPTTPEPTTATVKATIDSDQSSLESGLSEGHQVVEVRKDSLGREVIMEAPSNPEERQLSKEEAAEHDKKLLKQLEEAERLWRKEVDQLFAPSTPELRRLKSEYLKMREEFVNNQFKNLAPPTTDEEKNKLMKMSVDEIESYQKYVQDYDDRLRNLLGEELFAKYLKRRNAFMQKAFTEHRQPIEF